MSTPRIADLKSVRDENANAGIELNAQRVLSITNKSIETDVIKLNAFAMNIISIGNLQCFKNLSVLSLSSNSISNISALKQCTSLKEIYLRKNNIADLRQVIYLKKLKELQVLFLADNPCFSDESYRTKVLRILPGLSTLDVTNVEAAECQAAVTANSSIIITFEREANELDVAIAALGVNNLNEEKSHVADAKNSEIPPKIERVPQDISKSSLSSTNVFNAMRFLLAELDAADVIKLRGLCDEILNKQQVDVKFL